MSISPPSGKGPVDPINQYSQNTKDLEEVEMTLPEASGGATTPEDVARNAKFLSNSNLPERMQRVIDRHLNGTISAIQSVTDDDINALKLRVLKHSLGLDSALLELSITKGMEKQNEGVDDG